jgi:hypothetical protein
MQGKFTPYPSELLPEGFRYPARYLEFVRGMKLPAGVVWAFPTDKFDQAISEWKGRLRFKSKGWKYLTDIDPIPFARNGDWAAFFDGNDHSGDPKFVVADLGNTQNSYTHENFDAWLDRAIKDSGLRP